MIKINLLPSDLRGKAARETTPAGPAAGKAATAGIIAGVTALCLLAAFLFYSKVNSAVREADEWKKTVANKQSVYDKKLSENQQMKEKWDRMTIQEEILNVLMPDDPLLWSEKLNMISNMIPEGVYITDLEVQESTELVETERSIQLRKEYEDKKAKAKGKEGKEGAKEDKLALPDKAPEPIKKPIIRQTLILKAIATGQDRTERFDKVREFGRRMKEYQMQGQQGKVRRFMDNFQPDIFFGTGEATVHDGVEVWDFEMRLTTRPFGYTPSDAKS